MKSASQPPGLFLLDAPLEDHQSHSTTLKQLTKDSTVPEGVVAPQEMHVTCSHLGRRPNQAAVPTPWVRSAGALRLTGGI